ncbi:MAG: sialidase family protein [Opitutaceae bacterium]|tara:strand:- start:3353 stop:4534 length:1182 start_codon:yes stop_codon:yes gene_type:complete
MKIPSTLVRVTALLFLGVAVAVTQGADAPMGVRKVKDIVIYEDDGFHAAFPSVVKRPDGEVWVAFRRAPNRLLWGETHNNHVDPNSYLMMVRSSDGVTFSPEPELIYADAWGGSQDPCMLQLRDGTLLCMTYGWTFVRPEGIANLKAPVRNVGSGAIFNGGYYLRSEDGGEHWQGPMRAPHIEPELLRDPFGEPITAYNRGAAVEGKDGRLFWVAAATDRISPHRTSNHLMISEDKGLSWEYSTSVAVDDEVTFNEASIYETPQGDLVAFLRTANFEDQACIARSTDGGRSFEPWQGMGWQGHPLHATRLPDDRVLLVYGYRHAPMGIRARVLNAECTDFATAPEIVLRDDGTTSDLGYPWSVMLDDKRVLVTYYINVDGGLQHIAGTILALD